MIKVLSKMWLPMLVFALWLALVPTAYAQQQVDFDEILRYLGPRSGGKETDLLFDILLYLIFFLGLITMFLCGENDKQLLPQLLMMLVIGMAVVSKVNWGVSTGALFRKEDFLVFVVNVGMWVVPWIVAGLVRAPQKSKSRRAKALMPAIITGFVGGAYFFLFWAIEQRS